MIRIEMLEDMPMHQFADLVGFIPSFLNDESDKPAKEQIDDHYQHGGGWNSFDGFRIVRQNPMTIKYPEDPELRAIARIRVNDETVYIFPMAWVLIMQKDGSWEIARID
jgi:hypothetical protein